MKRSNARKRKLGPNGRFIQYLFKKVHCHELARRLGWSAQKLHFKLYVKRRFYSEEIAEYARAVNMPAPVLADIYAQKFTGKDKIFIKNA